MIGSEHLRFTMFCCLKNQTSTGFIIGKHDKILGSLGWLLKVAFLLRVKFFFNLYSIGQKYQATANGIL